MGVSVRSPPGSREDPGAPPSDMHRRLPVGGHTTSREVPGVMHACIMGLTAESTCVLGIREQWPGILDPYSIKRSRHNVHNYADGTAE